jgi:hypothetical protein
MNEAPVELSQHFIFRTLAVRAEQAKMSADAAVAQWQSTRFPSWLLWVRLPSAALILPEKHLVFPFFSPHPRSPAGHASNNIKHVAPTGFGSAERCFTMTG